MKAKSALIPTLTKTKEGFKIDAYDVSVNIDGVDIPAGTLYILRSLLKERRINIDIGPGTCKLRDIFGAESQSSTDAPEASPKTAENSETDTGANTAATAE